MEPIRIGCEEAAAEKDCWLRGRQPVSGEPVPGGTQSTFCATGGQARGLSRAETDGPRILIEACSHVPQIFPFQDEYHFETQSRFTINRP